MKIEINGIKYEIKEVSQKEYKKIRVVEDEKTEVKSPDMSTGVYYGASHHYQDTIYIDKELPEDRKRKTLMHELAHCYISEYITHEEKNYDEEMVCDIVANSHDIIENIVNKYFRVAKFK